MSCNLNVSDLTFWCPKWNSNHKQITGSHNRNLKNWYEEKIFCVKWEIFDKNIAILSIIMVNVATWQDRSYKVYLAFYRENKTIITSAVRSGHTWDVRTIVKNVVSLDPTTLPPPSTTDMFVFPECKTNIKSNVQTYPTSSSRYNLF